MHLTLFRSLELKLMKHLVVLAMIAIMGVPAVAAAADPKPSSVCKADKQKFCKDAKSTGVKVRDCLMQHKDELSDACKTYVDRPKKTGKKKESTAPTTPEAKPAQSETPPAKSETK
jgi:hypothetical protein